MLLTMGFQIPAQQLKITEDNRHIVYEDGKPFFWLGDTAWELFHRLTREEADIYLQDRATKGFNVIQAVVLAELNGLQEPNAYGETPFKGLDPSKPNEAYFQHVDYIINKANELGMYVGLLPTWGDKFRRMQGVGPVIFNPQNAYLYGKYLGQRYKNSNIIWVLGGDRNPSGDGHMQIIRSMAKGIRAEVKKTQLLTYHPMGGSNSAMWFHNEDWLDLTMFQSGHGQLDNQNYKITNRIYGLENTKPVLDGEPCYEDHPINWNPANGWFDEFESRRSGYWSVLAGACGHTYGNHNIWQMWTDGRKPIANARTPWREALDYPGALQAGYMKAFFESLEWQKLLPCQEAIVSGPDAAGKDIVAAMAIDSSFFVAYTSYGNEMTIDLSRLKSDTIIAQWYNPRSSDYLKLGEIKKDTKVLFDPPENPARGNDWVLLLKIEH